MHSHQASKTLIHRMLALLTVLLTASAGQAQTDAVPEVPDRRDWDTFVELFSELSGEEGSPETADEERMNDLFEIYCNPINLNDFDADQLRSLPFLNESQVLDILAYTATHRPLLSTGELMSLRSLDYPTRRLLQLFCRAGALPVARPTPARALKYADNELTLRTDIPLYTKMGFASYPRSVLEQSPNKVYQGSRPYYSLRYTFSTLRHVEAGLMMEKDAGEDNIDYWSAYAVLRKLGRLETLAVGSYRACFGMGLVVNTSSGFSKLMILNTLGRTDRGFRRHSSMSENGYFTGIGTTVRLTDALRLSAFASNRNTDGTLRSDSTGVSSLKTDGLHRTLLEKSKKGNLTKTDFGGNIQWQIRQLRLSATAAFTHFSLPLLPKHDTQASLYRLYNAAGRDFASYGLAYSWQGRNIRLSGETATGKSGGVATINMLQTDLNSTTLTLIQRYFHERYVSINGKTFSENSSPQNESGLYVGILHRLSRRLSLAAFADGMYFPWMKYQVSGRSWGIDALAQLVYAAPNDEWSVRYRIKSKQRNVEVPAFVGSDSTAIRLYFNTVQSLRLQHQHTFSTALTLKTLLTAAAAHRADTGTKWGLAVGENLTWRTPLSRRPKAGTLKVAAGITYFHTDDYSARVYAYEPSLLYTFGMRAYYYHGLRAYLLSAVPLGSSLTLVAKLGHTRLFDRDQIGSGLDLIPRNHREDLQFQLRWRF